MATAALSYQEPEIVTILIHSSFLLLLNIVNWILDNAVYCGLLGQVFVGVAWGVPGADWLSHEVQNTIMQLGYLGLILIVFEGGLSTSFAALWSNLYLSGLVALIGISAPIALSFILQKLLNATPVQAFAAGAALCSTSLGTTFTILSTSGLEKSRLGVILSSAAMLDDVAGLVMVQVISNLGTSAENFSAVTVVRPVFVSIAFAATVPLICRLIVQPLTRSVVERSLKKGRKLQRWTATPAAAFFAQTLVLLGLVTGSSYAGTSNLFAAYIAGAVINWWDALFLSLLKTNGQKMGEGRVSELTEESRTQIMGEAQTRHKQATQPEQKHDGFSGIAIYNRFYGPAVDFVLKPFFFASIGFSIPITQMFHSAILWRGTVYTILMIVGKLICGLVLVRFNGLPQFNILPNVLRRSSSKLAKKEKSAAVEPTLESSAPETLENSTLETSEHNSTVSGPSTQQAQQEQQPSASTANIPSKCAAASNTPNPQSLYPAAILGSAMVARGEIGFLISSLAESTGVFGSGSPSTGGSSEIFLVVTWAILLCTVIGPVSVGVMVKRVRRLQRLERGSGSGRSDPLGIWGVM